MNYRQILLGGAVASVLGAAGRAMGAFTVIGDSDSALQDTSSTMSTVDQVVLGDSGQVAAIVDVGGLSNRAVIYNSDPSGLLTQRQALTETVAMTGATGPNANVVGKMWGSGAGGSTAFENNAAVHAFSNLSLSGNGTGGTRLTFVARQFNGDVTPHTFGVLQYDPSVNSPGTLGTQMRALVSGDTPFAATPTQAVTLNTSGSLVDGGVGEEVTSAGHVVFGAANLPLSGGTQYVLNGNGAVAPAVMAQTPTVTNFNPGAVKSERAAYSAVGVDHAVFLQGSGVSASIVDATAGNSPMTRSFGAAFSGYVPTQLLGATATDTLLRATKAGVNSFVYSHAGATTVLDSSLLQSGAELSAGGKAAYFLEDSVGNVTKVQYFDGHSAVPTLVSAAQLNENVGGGVTIDSLGLDSDEAPMVNDQGEVVFGASLSNGNDALLAWNASSNALSIVAQVGDQVTVGSSTVTISSIDVNAQGWDSDVLKDGLNEANQVAFGVGYDDDDGAAILLTSLGSAVPEPGTAALVGMASFGMLVRRRRRALAA